MSRTAIASTSQVAVARHRHPRRGEPVGDREPEPLGLVAIDRDDQLVALVLGQLLAPGREVLLAGDDEHRERRRPRLHRPVELGPGRVLAQPLVLGLEHDPPLGGAGAGADLDQGVALLAPALGPLAAGMRGDVAAGAGDRLDRRVDALLEADPLAGSGRLRLGELELVLVLVEQAGEVLLELVDLGLHRPRLGRVRLAQLLDLGAVALLGLEDLLPDPDLHRVQRVRGVLGGQRGEQLLALLARLPGDDLLDLRLDRVVALGTEGGRDPLAERLGALLQRAAQPAVELVEALAELALDVVDVGGRALALDQAGADLDRLGHRLGRRPTLGGLLAHDPGGARVGDGQPLDHEPVLDHPDGAVAGGLIEGELWSFGRFHENLPR